MWWWCAYHRIGQNETRASQTGRGTSYGWKDQCVCLSRMFRQEQGRRARSLRNGYTSRPSGKHPPFKEIRSLHFPQVEHWLMFLFLFTGQEEKEAQVYDFVTEACEKNRNKKKIRNRWGSGFFPFFEKRNKQKQTEPSTNNEPFFSFFLYFLKLLLPISVREARPRGCEK